VLRFGQRARPQLPEVETVEQAINYIKWELFDHKVYNDKGLVIAKPFSASDLELYIWTPEEAIEFANKSIEHAISRMLDNDPELVQEFKNKLEEVLGRQIF